MNDNAQDLGAARAAYYAANGMPPDGGISAAWVHAKLGPIPFAFPNSDSRRELVPYHDLHHVLTGYTTDLAGEAQVGAWEIGSGMRAATGVLLDLLVWGFVVPAKPRIVLRAFVRGRRSRNLMPHTLDAALLARSVGETRRELHLDEVAAAPTGDDRLAFAGWTLLAVTLTWGPLIPLAWALHWALA